MSLLEGARIVGLFDRVRTKERARCMGKTTDSVKNNRIE
jgi:hypothetical protein